jgi:SAM-dependent methyltransferase
MRQIATLRLGLTTRSADAYETRVASEHVQPYPLLPKYYATLDAWDRFVRTLFNRTAVDYDRINRIFSFGSGSWYRRTAPRRAGLSHGATLLDVATGTGLVAREAVRVCGHRQYVTGLDLTENMLANRAQFPRHQSDPGPCRGPANRRGEHGFL